MLTALAPEWANTTGFIYLSFIFVPASVDLPLCHEDTTFNYCLLRLVITMLCRKDTNAKKDMDIKGCYKHLRETVKYEPV